METSDTHLDDKSNEETKKKQNECDIDSDTEVVTGFQGIVFEDQKTQPNGHVKVNAEKAMEANSTVVNNSEPQADDTEDVVDTLSQSSQEKFNEQPPKVDHEKNSKQMLDTQSVQNSTVLATDDLSGPNGSLLEDRASSHMNNGSADYNLQDEKNNQAVVTHMSIKDKEISTSNAVKPCSKEINQVAMERDSEHGNTEKHEIDDGAKPTDEGIENAEIDTSSSENVQRERKPLSRRNKSVGSFRKFFKKHRHSTSVGGLRSDSFSYPSSPNACRVASSPLTPLADDVFNLVDATTSADQGKPVKSMSESEEYTSKRRHSFRSKFASLPAYSRSRSQMDERSSQGSLLWKKAQKAFLGSFSFNRQLSPSGQSPENGCFSTENKVDSVYQVLKEGIILRTCKESGSSGCSSLHRNSSMDSNPSPSASDTNIKSGTDSNSPLMRKKGSNQQLAESSGASPSHNQETARGTPEQRGESPLKELTYQKKNSRSPSPGEGPTDELQPETRGQLKIQQMERYVEEGNLFVALYKFEAKQRDDLSLRPGDRVVVTNDKDEAWWIGECENKSGFFPANFVMSVRPTEEICHCIQATTLKDTNNKEIQLKRNQVLAIRLDWPVSNANYVYARSPSAEGYVRKEDLQPL